MKMPGLIYRRHHVRGLFTSRIELQSVSCLSPSSTIYQKVDMNLIWHVTEHIDNIMSPLAVMLAWVESLNSRLGIIESSTLLRRDIWLCNYIMHFPATNLNIAMCQNDHTPANDSVIFLLSPKIQHLKRVLARIDNGCQKKAQKYKKRTEMTWDRYYTIAICSLWYDA